MKGARSIGTTRGMKRWYSRMPKCRECKKTYLVATEAHSRGLCSACFNKAFQIEVGEWYCAGCFIQHSEHRELYGRYEVFQDDEGQTHVGRYATFAEAKKAARENKVDNPLNGLKAYRS